MNRDYYQKANVINCSKIYRDKIQFMTLGQIKKLHEEHGVCGKSLKLDQDTMISTINIINQKTKS